MIVILDIESTGVDKAKDQIVELCLQFGLADDSERRTRRIRPSIPIPAEATAVHGITDADVAACPTFAQVARDVVRLLSEAEVIVGYNVAFDLDMLQAELARAGLPPLDLTAKHVVDVLRLWHNVEPRTLAAAHEKFCGAPLEGAHAAGADVPATARVLEAMLAKFGLAALPWPELAAIANPFPGRENWIGPSSHIQWREDGRAVFAFGKNKGCRVDEVDPGFLQWVVGKDFPPHVKDVCRAALRMTGEPLAVWIANQYPRVALKEAG